MLKKISAILLLFLITLFSLFSVTKVNAAPPTGFSTSLIVNDLESPTAFDIAPDGRIFILEKSGVVKIYKNGQVLSTPFAKLNANQDGERGLLGLAFDPDFENNKFVYFYYTGQDRINRIVRLNASGDTGSDQTTIYEVPILAENIHQAGTLRFGQDGKIYLSIGNNGSPEYSQDLTRVYGKILRLNKDGSVPDDNPFVNQGANHGEIWAYGLRNPFRFQFDSENGKLYAADVGDSKWEEVNLIGKGKNYGYSTSEGACDNCSFENPIYQYFHDQSKSYSITGGPIYRGNMFPEEYEGNYFFGDYAQGFIKRLSFDSNGNPTSHDFDLSAGSVVDMKVAKDGSLYYLTIFPGQLNKVSYTPDDQLPIVHADADVKKGSAPLTVHFTSAGSSDPEGKQLTYDWKFGDGTESNSENPEKIYDKTGTYKAVLTVSDGKNNVTSDEITIEVGQLPTIIIDTPNDNFKYNAGQKILYEAHATDSAGQALADSAFRTDIIFHHDTHIHPFLTLEGNSRGGFIIPSKNDHTDTNTWYEVKFTVKDKDGLEETNSVNIHPNTSKMTFATVPSGLALNLDSIPITTPQTVEGVVGFERDISAPSVQKLGDKYYQFTKWSNGGAMSQTITTPATDTAYTAYFEEATPFTAQYFNNLNLSGEAVLTRAEAQIDNEWNNDSPDPKVDKDQFSARWTREATVDEGLYKFNVEADDGIRVIIDGQKVLDKWFDQSRTKYTFEKYLDSNKHKIVVEYFENYGGAIAKVDMTKISQAMVGFVGEYFDNISLSGSPVITKKSDSINYVWNADSPDEKIPADKFSARWITTQSFAGGRERFFIRAGDGVRFYIDDKLVVDDWTDHAVRSYSVEQNISQGEHTLKLEYFEDTGGAAVILDKVSD